MSKEAVKSSPRKCARLASMQKAPASNNEEEINTPHWSRSRKPRETHKRGKVNYQEVSGSEEDDPDSSENESPHKQSPKKIGDNLSSDDENLEQKLKTVILPSATPELAWLDHILTMTLQAKNNQGKAKPAKKKDWKKKKQQGKGDEIREKESAHEDESGENADLLSGQQGQPRNSRSLLGHRRVVTSNSEDITELATAS